MKNSSKASIKQVSEPCNPLNLFIYEKFVHMKRTADSVGNKNASFCYKKILRSLSKYPMPILSVTQALAIDGVGEKTASMIGKLLKERYSPFITEVRPGTSSLGAEIPEVIQNKKEKKSKKSKKEEPTIIPITEEDQTLELIPTLETIDEATIVLPPALNNEQEISQSISQLDINSKKRIIIEDESDLYLDEVQFSSQRKKMSNQPLIDNSNLTSSSASNIGSYVNITRLDKPIKSSVKSKYNPEIDTNPWAIIISLYKFFIDKNKKYATKKEIKESASALNEVFKCEIGNWNSLKTLIKKDVVFSFQFEEGDKYGLTSAGEELAKRLYEERMATVDTIVRGSEADLDLSNFMFSNDGNSSSRNYSNLLKNFGGLSSIREEVRLEKPNTPPKVGNNHEARGLATSDEKVLRMKHKCPKNLIYGMKVLLLIDNREVKNQSERSYIFEKIKEMGVDCELTNLPIGDFLWILELADSNDEKDYYVLEYIVERKRADDLASSIMDGRYSQQKYRLRQTLLPHIFYLIEGKASKNSVLPQNIIDKAVINTRVSNNFKIKYAENLQESIKWLTYMTYLIQNIYNRKRGDLISSRDLEFPYTLEEFLGRNTKAQTLTIKNAFGNMLRSIKGCGREATSEIIKAFPTPLTFFAEINKLSTYDERFQLLNSSTRPPSKKNGKVEMRNLINVPRKLAQTLISLFCDEKYPEDKEVLKDGDEL